MAFQKINTTRVHDWEQKEIIETRLIAGDDGVVEEVEVLVQPYIHTWVDVEIYQEIFKDINRSNFKAQLVYYASTGENGEGCSITVKDYSNSAIALSNFYPTIRQFNSTSTKSSVIETITLNPGETKSIQGMWIDWDKNYYEGLGNFKPLYHRLDGSFIYCGGGGSVSGVYSPVDFYCNGSFYYTLTCITSELEQEHKFTPSQMDTDFKIDFVPLSNDRAVYAITATNFNDEENPSFTYKASTGYTGRSYLKYPYSSDVYRWNWDFISSIQVSLSFDGITPDIAYRDIPINGTEYTFDLTEEEREVLRVKAQGSNIVPIYYLIKTTRYGEWDELASEAFTEQVEYFGATQRNFTVIGCVPTLNPTVEDINSDTLALTGSKYTFVRYESMAEFSTGATASKHATIVNQSVQCGSKTVYNLYNGVIDDIESAAFIFNATDSRGLNADQVVIQGTLVEYVKPTCKQNLQIQVSGETGAIVNLKVSGSCYNGSFGLTNNELILEVRYVDENGELGEWTTLTDDVTWNGNEYELSTQFTGFNYDVAYIFQCRATDKLNFVETSQYKIKLMPVFDWSGEDFNFNVPVNINGDNLDMYGETIIRHNETANNTVLSATGGHIYLRPGGTNDTNGEVKISSDGSIECGNDIKATSFSIGNNSIADYVIETGEEAMGSNGTWYWAKWASGKAECWGCRNYGNMAVSTNWGGLFRSEIFSQDLPDNVFVTTPDVININLVSVGYGGWICKHENAAPSAVTTGSFIVVRPAAATITPSYIGFHVIGLWKQ